MTHDEIMREFVIKLIVGLIVGLILMVVGAVLGPLFKRIWDRINRPEPLTPQTEGQLVTAQVWLRRRWID